MLTVTFRYDYRLNGRRETLTIGRYGPAGVSLALAREKLLDAKKAVAAGKSPAHEKQREKRRLTADKESAPDYRLQTAGHDIGAAWKKTCETVYVRLIEGEDGTHDLIWSRSKPQAA